MLTHFHADHVDGLAGVLDGRRSGRSWSPGWPTRPTAPRVVAEAAGRRAWRPHAAPYGETRTVGAVTLQVLWPPPGPAPTGPGDGSAANDASVVLLVEVGGVRLLLTGDVEPRGPGRAGPDLARAAASTCSRCRTTAAATRTSPS